MSMDHSIHKSRLSYRQISRLYVCIQDCYGVYAPGNPRKVGPAFGEGASEPRICAAHSQVGMEENEMTNHSRDERASGFRVARTSNVDLIAVAVRNGTFYGAVHVGEAKGGRKI